MSKLLKGGIFGIVCVVSAVNATQEKDSLKKDYETIKTTILNYEIERTKQFDQSVEQQIKELDEKIYWAHRMTMYNPSFCEGRGDYNDSWDEYSKTVKDIRLDSHKRKKSLEKERRALCEANNRPYDLEAMCIPSSIDDYKTELTFGQLKSMVKDNKYIL